MRDIPERELGLEFVSVFGMGPVGYARLAAELGCRHVIASLEPLTYATPWFAPHSLREDAALRRNFVAAILSAARNLIEQI